MDNLAEEKHCCYVNEKFKQKSSFSNALCLTNRESVCVMRKRYENI